MLPKTPKLRPANFTDVTIDGAFWAPRIQTNSDVTLAHEYRMCKETGRIDAFRLDWKPGKPNKPHIFWDSDVAKWVEAASYSLAIRPDPKLAKLLDEVVGLIASAQQSDGYLNTHYTTVEPDKRWTNLRDCHELYSAGHMMEAGVAHFHATGKRTLLDAVCRYADYIDSVFGREPGKKRGYCGHEEIELALVKLYRVTGNERYLRLSKYFIDERGATPRYFDQEAAARGEDAQAIAENTYEVLQAHKPVRQQKEAAGHAVRAMYLYTAMADLAGEMGDADLLAACRRLWQDVTQRKMFITGGVGSSAPGESFTREYDLPNEAAYAETCAAIGLVLFAHRMLQMDPDRQYSDVIERALYNGILSGVSLDGMNFFYVNPLASCGHRPPGVGGPATASREPFFGCACCPTNIARLLPSLGQYVYSSSDSAAYVHLYIGGSGRLDMAGRQITVSQETQYPWDGQVKLTVGLESRAKFDLMLRIPGWCRKYKLMVNGKRLAAPIVKGYAKIRRTWEDGDVVTLKMDMPVERIVAHPEVAEDAGRVAIQRGPIVYCLEESDNTADVRSMRLGSKSTLKARFDKKLLGGCVVIEGQALATSTTGWNGQLYRPASVQALKAVKFKAVPYCLWNNRGVGKMTVWLPMA